MMFRMWLVSIVEVLMFCIWCRLLLCGQMLFQVCGKLLLVFVRLGIQDVGQSILVGIRFCQKQLLIFDWKYRLKMLVELGQKMVFEVNLLVLMVLMKLFSWVMFMFGSWLICLRLVLRLDMLCMWLVIDVIWFILFVRLGRLVISLVDWMDWVNCDGMDDQDERIELMVLGQFDSLFMLGYCIEFGKENDWLVSMLVSSFIGLLIMLVLWELQILVDLVDELVLFSGVVRNVLLRLELVVVMMWLMLFQGWLIGLWYVDMIVLGMQCWMWNEVLMLYLMKMYFSQKYMFVGFYLMQVGSVDIVFVRIVVVLV